MANINLFGKGWTNIVFEGRNKEYGAYKLRQENPKNTMMALVLGMVCIALAFGGSFLYKSVFGERINKETNDTGVEVLDIELPELPEPIEEIKEEPIVEPPKEEPADASKSVQEEKKFTEMEVKKDTEVKKEEITSQKEFNDDIQSGRQDREASKDGDFKTKGEQTGGADKGSQGTGKGNTFSDDENKIYTFGVTKAEPNEGLQKFYQNFARKFNAPDVGGGVSEIVVRLRFVVEKDGSFTDIQVIDDKQGVGKEAIRVLKSMPQWKPAKHNDRTVRSSFTLPIKIKVNN